MQQVSAILAHLYPLVIICDAQHCEDRLEVDRIVHYAIII